ncbi:hypothetical protein M5689_002210 [Euphorbia peplus]|nr:hypothetical protein M5689_002210 [Euphorbia peplus]
MASPPLVELSDTEIRLDFHLNSKCRATIRLRSLSATTPIAFKIQTSSPHKFLVNPPTGFIPPLSTATFQIILKPQTHIPSSFPRSPADRFLIKTAPFVANSSDSLNSWFSSLPRGATQDFKLKVAFVGSFLLRHAVSSGDIETVRNMIKRQRSILAELAPGEAELLLRVATELRDPEDMVHLLLESGLKIEARVKGENPTRENLSCYPVEWNEVCSGMEFDEISDMVERFGPLDLRDNAGRTPLILAANKGDIRCVRALVESGADKNCRSKDGRTALHRAAVNGDRRMVEMLIEMDADPSIEDNRGRSAFDVARDKGYEEISEILEQGEAVLTSARRGDSKRLESLL